jgi:hypothetical protein
MPGTLAHKFVSMQSAKPKNVTKTLLDTAHSGKRFVRKIGDPQWWEFDFTTPPLTYAQALELFAFVCSQGGQYGTFYIPNPFPTIAQNLTARVAPNIAVGADSFALSSSNYMVGDFIQFSSHDKTYLVTNVTESTVSFYPKLKSAVGAASPIKYGTDVLFKVALQNDENDLLVKATNGKYTEIKLDVVEDI